MSAPPPVTSVEEHVARRGDAAFWRPYVGILDRHDLGAAAGALEAVTNATHPTFVCGDVVVKLFGCGPAWRRSHEAERAPAIAESRVLAEGCLSDDEHAPWPYRVTTSMRGQPWRLATLSPTEGHAVAVDLGEQVVRLHALPAEGLATHQDWATVEVTDAAHRTSLPPHLVEQAGDYVARLGSPEPAPAHAHLVDMHVFVEGGRLSGIIDWGDGRHRPHPEAPARRGTYRELNAT